MLKVERMDFPLLASNDFLIYLDSAATSLKPKSVISKCNEYYTNYGVNINRGVYDLSQMATDAYEESRNAMAKFINAKAEEVVFTKGCTASLNMLAYMLEDKINEGDEIVVSVLDHHSFIIPMQELAKRKKAMLVYAPLDENYDITPSNLKQVLTNKTKIVCLTYVSNVIGRINDVEALSKISHEIGALVIVDAAQAAPHIKIDVRKLDVDFLAFSIHKMLGPTGVGVLYGKKKLLNSLNPVEFGGDMNDGVELLYSTYKDTPHRFEAGTPNIEGIIGTIESIKYLSNLGMDNIYNHSKELATYVVEELKKIKGLNIYTIKPDTGIVTFNIDGIHPHDLATYLSSLNICVRAGHHCAQLITKYLGVVGTVRASFYLYNTMEDAKALVEGVKSAVVYFKEWM